MSEYCDEHEITDPARSSPSACAGVMNSSPASIRRCSQKPPTGTDMLLIICEWCKINRCDLCDEEICECEHLDYPDDDAYE